MDKQDPLKSALASTSMEGIDLDADIIRIIAKSLEEEKTDKSLLYAINEFFENQKNMKQAGETKDGKSK